MLEIKYAKNKFSCEWHNPSSSHQVRKCLCMNPCLHNWGKGVSPPLPSSCAVPLRIVGEVDMFACKTTRECIVDDVRLRHLAALEYLLL
jgi:hypothetical protein